MPAKALDPSRNVLLMTSMCAPLDIVSAVGGVGTSGKGLQTQMW